MRSNRSYDRKAQKIIDFSEGIVDSAYREFKKTTPIDTGNARRSTDLQGNVIDADYPYATRLNNGWSKQAPNGMTEPTIKYIRRQVKRTFGG
jgi:hypothetical protein